MACGPTNPTGTPGYCSRMTALVANLGRLLIDPWELARERLFLPANG